jgi:DNA helicase-2/ATP-dependent DNA helicase PcrA
MKKPNYSEYQKAVFQFIETGAGNAVINAVAGAGKTFTITKALELIPEDQKVLFIAFNRHIVDELRAKLDKVNKKNVDIMTIHSYGGKVIRRNIKSWLDADKVWKVCDNLFPTWKVDPEVASGYIGRVKRLVELAKLNLIDTVPALYDQALKHDIEILNGEIENAIQVKNITDKDTRTHDFNDMIYYPTRHSLRGEQYDWVFIDECQDLSTAQQELMKRAVKPNGRFVAVGDPRQCIYGFAGADVESFRKLSALPNTTQLPLSLTYRCAKNIVTHAQSIVPHIQALPEAEDGIVRYDGKISEISSSDMILSRVNRPLITLCIRLLGQGQKAYVKGKDIGLNLTNMLKKTRRAKLLDAIKVLDLEKQKMIVKMIARGVSQPDAENSVLVRSFEEKLDAIDALSIGLTQVQQVIDRINSIFADEKEGICLSSVHKAKGLEADRVFIVEPQTMPAPWVKKDWEQEQEENIHYVAITRARKELVYIPEEEFTTYKRKNS